MADRASNNEKVLKIASKIKELRKSMGYSSYESFALDFGLNPRYYYRLEKGTNCSLEYFIKILDIHKIGLKEFFDSF